LSAPFPTTVREGRPADINFILNSWLKSTEKCPIFHKVPNEIFFTEQRKRIIHVLEEGSVRIICDPDDQDQIYAYLVYEFKDPVLLLHYLYTKRPYRKLGLSRLLLLTTPKAQMTMHTFRFVSKGFGSDHLTNKLKSKYNPYLFLGRGV